MSSTQRAVLLPALLAYALAIAAVCTAADDAGEWPFPEERTFGEHRAIIHAPQVLAWPDFKQVEALVAMEFFPAGASEVRLASVRVTSKTELLFDKRMVVASEPVVTEVNFADGPHSSWETLIREGVRRSQLEIPLDIFLAALADDVLEGEPPAGFNASAPEIRVVETPTILLFVNGPPLAQPLEETGLDIVVNANWPLLRRPATGEYFLLQGDHWLRAKALAGPWSATRAAPVELKRLGDNTAHPAIAAAFPAPRSSGPAPVVIYSERPLELVVLEGAPQLEPIEGTGGLRYVANTETPLFQLEGPWYLTAAGRWFSSTDLSATDWTLVKSLPEAFQTIPPEHTLGIIRASIPGTVEARMAALEALLPRETSVASNAAPGIDVTYDGVPDFQPSGAKGVSRAANTQYFVFLVEETYYLCYGGIWYQSASAGGPWVATADVPEAIYQIPPSSPAYPVTDVKVASSSSSTVTYTHTPAYSSSVYVAYGVPWYGTGWYYPPYVGYYYYPYYTSYGHGSFYNPNTGTYGSRSVWYGPYGGYSYNEAYNPNTGRYGYMETAWDGDEWASYSQVHGSRTGIDATTERYYSEDKDRMETERTLNQGDRSMDVKRTTDFDDGWSESSRQASEGGSADVRREFDDSGELTSSGAITGKDGQTADLSGSYQDGQGSTTITGSEGGTATMERSTEEGTVTREGSAQNADGETFSSNTTRTDGTSKTLAESSSGGSLASSREGTSRTTVGQSSSGDLYAGKDGNLYRNTGDGWQHYDSGSREWSQPVTPDRTGNQSFGTQRNHDFSQLNRDSRARRMGYDNFQRQRGGAGRRGGLRGRR